MMKVVHRIGVLGLVHGRFMVGHGGHPKTWFIAVEWVIHNARSPTS